MKLYMTVTNGHISVTENIVKDSITKIMLYSIYYTC